MVMEQQREIFCYNCGQPGHTRRACKGKVVANSESFPPCTFCNKTNHLAKDCYFRKCKSCGNPGHVASACRSKAGAGPKDTQMEVLKLLQQISQAVKSGALRGGDASQPRGGDASQPRGGDASQPRGGNNSHGRKRKQQQKN
eukprot:jgi/Mesvir1/19902/Mv25392-RA.1